MTSIIQTSVLRAAVLSAFDRGRYQVQFGTAPAGDDIAVVPASINLDLAERDDDLLGAEPFELFTDAEVRELRREVAAYQPESIVAGMFGADDHGPAVPAQDGPRVYEFALQGADCRFTTPKTLDEVQVGHAPDMNAFHAADWVHVYDRVTRERRTLKRPAEDKIVKGLADVAADLRGGVSRDPLEQALASVLEGHEGRISKPGEWRVWRDGDGRARWERFTQFEAVDPAPVPPPAPGPLTSAEGLVRGDVLRCIREGDGGMTEGRIVRIDRMHEWPGGHKEAVINGLCWRHDRFAFVGRPDADGWMDWPGGENPVGEATIDYLMASGGPATQERAENLRWEWAMSGNGGDIVRFRLVDMPSLPSDT